MRYLFVIILISLNGFSQTNETVINQAAQAVQSQNITTRTQALDALRANGMTETQARQLATQRGISYDQLINELFPNENSENPNTDETLQSDSSEENVEDSDEEKENVYEVDTENYGPKYFGYNIFNCHK